MRGGVAPLLDHQVGRFDDRGAGRHQRLRAAGAAARHQPVAVALHQPDGVEGHAELLVQHLRERRPVALPVVEGAGDDGHRAVRLEADLALLLRGRRGAFEEVADAPAAQLAARRALRLARGEAVPVRGAQRLLQHRREVAAVVGAAGRGPVGELLRLDVVEPAQLDRVPPGLARRLLQQPLHDSSCPPAARRRDRPRRAWCWSGWQRVFTSISGVA